MHKILLQTLCIMCQTVHQKWVKRYNTKPVRLAGGGGGGAGKSHRDFPFRRDFSGYRRPIFECFYIIRFVFPLAFQCHIQNCSTAKTREDMAKRKRKVENDGKEGGRDDSLTHGKFPCFQTKHTDFVLYRLTHF